MSPPGQHGAHDEKIEVSIAVLTQQMLALAASVGRIEALVDKQIAEKVTPWPQILGAMMLLMSPAAALYWHFEESVTQLRLVDRDSMAERRELRGAIASMNTQRCPFPTAARTSEH